MPRVMLVGLPKRELKRVAGYFQTVGVSCEALPTIETAVEKLPADPPTLIITPKPDLMESLHHLRHTLRTSAPATPFLVLLPDHKAASALEAMNAGAYDCLAGPLTKFRVLTAAKRAASANGRTLIGKKLKAEKTPWAAVSFLALLVLVAAKGVSVRWNGGPAPNLNLASATLSGIQWEDRSLWVGNWYDATVTHYLLKKGLTEKRRVLSAEEIFRMQDSQPILLCDTPDSLVTVGFDLKFRSHQRAVGLPTLQTASAPATNPTGLAWDGTDLWSSDGQTGLLYKHGPDLRVIDTVKSLIASPAGLAWDGKSLWVLGGSPLRLAKLERKGASVVWRGPFQLKNFLPPDVPASGMAIGFGRVWAVTGGAPHMISRPLKKIEKQLDGWK